MDVCQNRERPWQLRRRSNLWVNYWRKGGLDWLWLKVTSLVTTWKVGWSKERSQPKKSEHRTRTNTYLAHESWTWQNKLMLLFFEIILWLTDKEIWSIETQLINQPLINQYRLRQNWSLQTGTWNKSTLLIMMTMRNRSLIALQRDRWLDECLV